MYTIDILDASHKNYLVKFVNDTEISVLFSENKQKRVFFLLYKGDFALHVEVQEYSIKIMHKKCKFFKNKSKIHIYIFIKVLAH